MNKSKHYIALFIGTWCIGWSAIFVKMTGLPGIISAYYRVFIALAILLPVWIIRQLRYPEKRIPLFNKQILLAILGGIFFGLDLTFWNTSIMEGTASIATVLANFAPIWVALGAWLLWRNRTSNRVWLGTAVAMTGIFCILDFKQLQAAKISWADTLALVASFFYAIYLLTTQEVRKKLDTFSFMTFATLGSTLMLAVSAYFADISLALPPTNTWPALIGLGLITHVIGWMAINYALGFIPSTIASVSLLSQAVWTAIFGYIVLSEHLPIHQWIGGAIVLVGIWLVNSKRTIR